MGKKRSNKRSKGFTLVELIVVLVILAILAAIAIPSFMNYINKTRNTQMMVDCRACVLAAQLMYTENYPDDVGLVTTTAVTEEAGVSGTVTSIIHNDTYKVIHLTYEYQGYIVTYCSEYNICDEHDQLYNFGTGTGSGDGSGDGETPGVPTEAPLDPSKYFTVGDYTVEVEGTFESALNTSLQPGQVYSYNGDYYFIAMQYNLSTMNNFNSMLSSNSAIKISSFTPVPYSQNVAKGNFVVQNEQLYFCTVNNWEPTLKLVSKATLNT